MSKEAAVKTADKPATEGTEGGDAKVKINRDRYTPTKTATGVKSLNNGDEVAKILDGLIIDELFNIGKEMLGEDFAPKYSKLNIGMQRMNMGNRLRAKVRTIDADEKANEGDGLKALQKAAKPYTKARDKRVKEAEAKKVAKAKEAETKKKEAEAKKKAKAEEKAKKEKEANKPKAKAS